MDKQAKWAYALEIASKLAKYHSFSEVALTVAIMKEEKKDQYYATVVQNYDTDGFDVFNREATIYLNLRDLKSREMIEEAMVHESSHITGLEQRVLLNLIRNTGISDGGYDGD